MEYKTQISRVTEEGPKIRGKLMADLIQEKFSDVIFLLLTGKKPTVNQSILFEKMLILIIDHGMGTTSSMTTRYIASGGNPLHVAVGGGILSQGKFHGGAIESAMVQYASWHALDLPQQTEVLKKIITEKKTIYGFGHKYYKKGDPRVALLLGEMEKIDYHLSYLPLKKAIENIFSQLKGKPLYINIDGLLAMLLLDFSFDPQIANGIFLIGRCPGLVAQAYEEITTEKPVRRINEQDITLLG